MSQAAGCLYKLSDGLCNLMTAPGSHLCPKHILYAEEQATAKSRQARRGVATRVHRQKQEEALAKSPLAAESTTERSYDDGR